MESFCRMDLEAQMLFVLYIEGEYGMYYETLAAFLESCYSENVANAISALLDVEMSAITYNYYLSLYELGDVTEAELQELLDELQAAYTVYEEARGAITDAAEQQELEDFANIHAFYQELVENAGLNG